LAALREVCHAGLDRRICERRHDAVKFLDWIRRAGGGKAVAV